MWALENSIIRVSRAAQSTWMADFPGPSTVRE
jgi:hypothetical protein